MPVDTPLKRLLSIGEFANAARLSHKALRLYAQLGLLPPAQVEPHNGYRFYLPEQLPAARLIRVLREVGMPLAAIREVLVADKTQQVALLRAYQQSVEAHAALVRATLGPLLGSGPFAENPMPYQIEVEHLAAQPVASVTQPVLAVALDAHIATTVRVLAAFAQAQNVAPAGAPFGIYHGPINHTEDGPLEVCLPLPALVSPNASVTVRELPACTVACVTVRGAGCDFPAILGAYDAVADWINQNGYAMADAPREIWLAPLGPEGVMRVAWPFVGR